MSRSKPKIYCLSLACSRYQWNFTIKIALKTRFCLITYQSWEIHSVSMFKREFNLSFLLTFCLCVLMETTRADVVNCSDHESNIVFYGFKDSWVDGTIRLFKLIQIASNSIFRIDNMFVLTFDEQLEDYGCGPKDNVSIIVHGWLEGLNTTVWVNETITNLLKYTNGCVFFFDYSVYSKNGNYFALVPHYEKIADVLTKYLLHVGNPERIFMFGFSFGSRLTVEAGIASYNGSIERIELCDPAGPGFEGTARAKVPTLAGRNVACISTSNNYGTTLHNCHQNFRMGNCGYAQAAHGNYPKGSHGLCPYFFNAAFDFDFVPYNDYSCSSTRSANITHEVKMGFLGNFNRTEVRGDIFVSTAAREPYVAVPTGDVVKLLNDLSYYVRVFAQRQYQRRSDTGDEAMYKLRSDIINTTDIALSQLDTFIKTLKKSYPAEFKWT